MCGRFTLRKKLDAGIGSEISVGEVPSVKEWLTSCHGDQCRPPRGTQDGI